MLNVQNSVRTHDIALISGKTYCLFYVKVFCNIPMYLQFMQSAIYMLYIWHCRNPVYRYYMQSLAQTHYNLIIIAILVCIYIYIYNMLILFLTVVVLQTLHNIKLFFYNMLDQSVFFVCRSMYVCVLYMLKLSCLLICNENLNSFLFLIVH